MCCPSSIPHVRVRLEDYQLDLIGEVAAISESALCAVFGRSGRTLRARAQGIDPRPVLSPGAAVRVSRGPYLGYRYQRSRRAASPASDDERAPGSPASAAWANGRPAPAGGDLCRLHHHRASVPLEGRPPRSELWDAARRAFALANTKRLAVRAVSLTLDRLMETEAQLELWDGKRGGGEAGERHRAVRAVTLPHQTAPACPRSDPTPRYSPRSRDIHCPLRRARCIAAVPSHQTTTIFPKVALPSRTRCASAS